MNNSTSAHIAIIGAGGLGTPAALGLLAGWPTQHTLQLDIIDPDRIELSNLNRQLLFDPDDVGQHKALILAKRLCEQSHEKIKIRGLNEALCADNAEKLLQNVQYVIDATDSVETKFFINDFCQQRRIGFCYGGAIAGRGQLLSVRPGEIDLRGIFGDVAQDDLDQQLPTCQQAGIVGPVAGYIGLLQAERAIEYFLNEKSESQFYRFSLELKNTTPNGSCITNSQSSAHTLDLSQKKCPATFVYTKLALEKIVIGEQLEVLFGNETSATNVTQTLLDEGHAAQMLTADSENQRWKIIVERKN